VPDGTAAIDVLYRKYQKSSPAPCADIECLVKMDEAARQRPLAPAGFSGPADQQQLQALVANGRDDDIDGDCRVRVLVAVHRRSQ
jgi:hypothetical protein